MHEFWNVTNIGLQALNVGVQAADLLLTERLLAAGRRELNPWGKRRWQRIALKALGVALPIALAWLCHAVGWHAAEWVFPVIFMVPTGIALWLNLRVWLRGFSR